jgi:hypothetical protein
MDRRTKEVGALSYISTDEFNNNFFTYTVTNGPPPNFVKTGALTPVQGATSLTCPAGNILRENGKKLYPGAHNGVRTYMIGVFDMLSGLKGYINPNDPMFAPYNSDRPLYQLDSVYTGNNTTKNLGPSVLTQGPVMVSYINSASEVISAGQVRSSTVTTLDVDSSGNTVVDVSLGQVFTLAVNSPVSLTAINDAPGAHVYLKVTGGGSGGTLTFGSNVFGTGALSVAANQIYMVHFVSDADGNLCEVSRTAAYSDRT